MADATVPSQELWNSMSISKRDIFQKMTDDEKKEYIKKEYKKLKKRENNTALKGNNKNFTPATSSASSSSSSVPRVEDEVNYQYELTAESCKKKKAKLLKTAFDKKATKLRMKILALGLKFNASRLDSGLTTTELSEDDEEYLRDILGLIDELYSQVANLSVSQAKNTSEEFVSLFQTSFSAVKDILENEESKLGNFEDYPDLREPLGKLNFVSAKYDDYLKGRKILDKKMGRGSSTPKKRKKTGEPQPWELLLSSSKKPKVDEEEEE